MVVKNMMMKGPTVEIHEIAQQPWQLVEWGHMLGTWVQKINQRLREDQRMIILEEILYVDAKRGIFLILLFTLISSRNIMELHHRAPIPASILQAGVEVGLGRQWLKFLKTRKLLIQSILVKMDLLLKACLVLHLLEEQDLLTIKWCNSTNASYKNKDTLENWMDMVVLLTLSLGSVNVTIWNFHLQKWKNSPNFNNLLKLIKNHQPSMKS